MHQDGVAYLFGLLALAPEWSDETARNIVPRLGNMLKAALQQQRERASGASSSHANAYLSDRRLTTAAQVSEQVRRHRPVFDVPTSATSCLHAALEVMALESSILPPPPLPAVEASHNSAAASSSSSSSSMLQTDAIFRAGLAAAETAMARICTRAAASAAAVSTAAVLVGATGSTTLKMILDCTDDPEPSRRAAGDASTEGLQLQQSFDGRLLQEDGIRVEPSAYGTAAAAPYEALSEGCAGSGDQTGQKRRRPET